MRLPPCVVALIVSDKGSRETVLGFVHQTIRNLFLCSESFFFAVQILDAAGIWTKDQEVCEQFVAGISVVWVSVTLSDSVKCGHLREILPSSPLPSPSVRRELAGNATEFSDVVIGTFDETHVFPEDITVEENELLAASHFNVTDPAALLPSP